MVGVGKEVSHTQTPLHFVLDTGTKTTDDEDVVESEELHQRQAFGIMH